MDAKRKEFLNDVVIMSVENGIEYWTNTIRRYWNYNLKDSAYANIEYFYTSDDLQFACIDNKLIAKGLEKIMKGNYAIRDDILKEILIANVKNDSGYIDSECADVIVQIALFDQIVFG